MWKRRSDTNGNEDYGLRKKKDVNRWTSYRKQNNILSFYPAWIKKALLNQFFTLFLNNSIVVSFIKGIWILAIIIFSYDWQIYYLLITNFKLKVCSLGSIEYQIHYYITDENNWVLYWWSARTCTFYYVITVSDQSKLIKIILKNKNNDQITG